MMTDTQLFEYLYFSPKTIKNKLVNHFEILANNNIYYPIRLEYYKTQEIENFQPVYGIEVVKTEYKNTKINVENKVIDNITCEEKKINQILEKFRKRPLQLPSRG